MEISLHSNQKHIALSYYLSIIKNLIMSQNTPFKKLYYVDLYCGDGVCEVKKTGSEYECPLIDSILKKAKEGKFSVCCFLNDLDSIKIKGMKEHTKDFEGFVKQYSSEDANKCYKKILELIPKDQFCIFFLDPTNHKDLKWNTIKAISEHTHTYYGTRIRRPELIINLMIYTLLGSYKAGSYKSINENLGTDKWMDLITKYKDEGVKKPIEQAFLDTFVSQLKSLGYEVPTPIEIKSTRAKNNIYYLIWATNEAGYKIIENKVMPYLRRTVNKTLKSNENTLIKIGAKEKGNSSLDNWF